MKAKAAWLLRKKQESQANTTIMAWQAVHIM
jgi:hypothetical protein